VTLDVGFKVPQTLLHKSAVKTSWANTSIQIAASGSNDFHCRLADISSARCNTFFKLKTLNHYLIFNLANPVTNWRAGKAKPSVAMSARRRFSELRRKAENPPDLNN
jgi:hypothetical protein